MLNRLNAVGFTPFALLNSGGTVRLTAEDLRSLEGSLDIIWFREDRATPNTIAAMNIRDRGKLTLLEIAEQNKRVVTPL
jgi:hypothetical protein